MPDKQNRPDTIAGMALYAAMFTGFIAIIVAIFAFASANWVGAALSLVAAALAFGLVANAILRH